MSVAIIERKTVTDAEGESKLSEIYTITMTGNHTPQVKNYYRQSSFGNIFRGRRLDVIVLKNVELTEEALREIAPCLKPDGQLVEVPT